MTTHFAKEALETGKALIECGATKSMALLEVLDDMAPMNDELKEIAEPRRGRIQDERWWSRTRL